MLAVVKEPHIEMCLNGEDKDVRALLEVLRGRYDVTIVVNIDKTDVSESPKDDDEEYVKVEDTDWWKETVTPGYLLGGCRLMHDMTQAELARKSGISYATISAYENGKRKITRRAAVRLARALGEDETTFFERLTE